MKLKIYVVFITRYFRDTGMIVDSYTTNIDAFYNKDSAIELVEYLRQNITDCDVDFDELDIESEFDESKYDLYNYQ